MYIVNINLEDIVAKRNLGMSQMYCLHGLGIRLLAGYVIIRFDCLLRSFTAAVALVWI